MSTERTGGISIVGGGEEVTMGDEIDKGDRVGNEEPLGGGVYSGIQSFACSVERGRVVHLEVATLEGRVSGDEEREAKIAADIGEGELMMCDEWVCERVEERRWRDEVSYSLLRWTSCVSAPAQLSRSLLRLNTPSIGQGTCMQMGNYGGIRSFQSCTLLLPLLNQAAELGSSSCGHRFLGRA